LVAQEGAQHGRAVGGVQVGGVVVGPGEIGRAVERDDRLDGGVGGGVRRRAGGRQVGLAGGGGGQQGQMGARRTAEQRQLGGVDVPVGRGGVLPDPPDGALDV